MPNKPSKPTPLKESYNDSQRNRNNPNNDNKRIPTQVYIPRQPTTEPPPRPKK